MSEKANQAIKPSTPNKTRRTTGDLTLRIAAITAVLALAATFIMSLPQTRRSLVLATTRLPEPYTELYFNNSARLPKQILAGNPAIISYHVTNHEAQAKLYHAKITLVQNGKPTLLRTDTFILKDGQSKDAAIALTLPLPAAGQHIQLIVQLPDQNLEIHFRSQT